ncbi:MAG TPA: hypothetical protein VGO97_05285 [Solirubrobacterales bacterium]|nr:hypothetical protein [Solirubrobacterales bacterium]
MQVRLRASAHAVGVVVLALFVLFGIPDQAWASPSALLESVWLNAGMTTPGTAVTALPSAGGAPIDQLMIVAISYSLVATALVVCGFGYRAGRFGGLAKTSAKFGELTDKPYWSALPLVLLNVGRFAVIFGFYWDIAYHVELGRDPGPLTNQTHYFILIGALLICIAGVLLVLLPKERPGPRPVRIAHGWYAPVGGIAVLILGAFNLLGFTLDDVWHRIYGQDVTLWSPTHIISLGSGGLTTLALCLLLVESRPYGESYFNRHRFGWLSRLKPQRLDIVKLRRSLACGSTLMALAIFPSEFDAGVPQFRMVLQPILLLGIAGLVLTMTRVWLGRFSALYAAGFFLVMRALFEVWVDGVAGKITIHFPLFMAEAAAVEIAAVVLGTWRLRHEKDPRVRSASERQVIAATVAIGAIVGVVGFAAEYAWSQIWMPIPWNSNLVPLGLAGGTIAAVAGAVIGGWLGNNLRGTPAHGRAAMAAPILASVVFFSLMIGGLREDNRTGMTGNVQLTAASTGKPGRWVNARIRISDAKRADDALWLRGIAWQGGGFIEARMRRISPGLFETTEAIPVFGRWKSGIRLQTGSAVVSVPIFMPRDAAIPAAELPAPARFTRSFISDREVMQRESRVRSGAPVTIAAYSALGLYFMFLIAFFGWAFSRIGRRNEVLPEDGPRPRFGRSREPVEPEPASPLVSAREASAGGRVSS